MKLKSLLGWTLAVLVVLILVAVAAVKLLFPPDKIVAAVIPRIEDALDRQVEHGDVEFTIFTGLGVRIHDIRIKNIAGFDPDDFARIEALDCRVRFWPLLRGEVELYGIKAHRPQLYLIKSVDGTANYHGTESDIQAPGDESVLLAPLVLDRFEIRDGRYIHRNDSTGVKWVLGRIDFASDIRDDGDLHIKGELTADSLALHSNIKDLFFAPAGLEAKFVIDYLSDYDTLAVREFELKVSELEGRVEGGIGALSSSPRVDLSLVAPRVRLKRLERSPFLTAFAAFNDLELDGEMRLDAAYRGQVFDPDADNLKGKATFSNLQVDSPRLDAELKIRLAELNFNSQSFSFFTDGAEIGNVPASFSFAVDNFDDPNLSAEVKFSSGVNFITQLAQLDSRHELSGKIAVSLSGFMSWKERDNLRLLGSVEISGLAYDAPHLLEPIEELNFTGQFLGRDLQLQKFELKTDDNEISLTGKISGFTPYLAALGKPEKRPMLDFNLVSPRLDFAFLTDCREQGEPGDSLQSCPLLALFPEFDAGGTVYLNRAEYEGIRLERLNSHVTLLNHILHLDSIECEVYSGAAKGEVIVDLSDSTQPDWEIELRAQNIEINDFLSRFTGFDNHLFGESSLLAEFSAIGATATEIRSSLTGTGSIAIDRGKLVDFTPAELLDDRLGLSNLGRQNLRNLSGIFEVGEQQVLLTDIRCELGTTPLQFSGSIGFDNALSFDLQTSFLPDDTRHLTLPQRYRNKLDDAGGAELTLHLGNTASSPEFEIRSLTTRFPREAKFSDEVKNLMNALLKN